MKFTRKKTHNKSIKRDQKSVAFNEKIRCDGQGKVNIGVKK